MKQSAINFNVNDNFDTNSIVNVVIVQYDNVRLSLSDSSYRYG